MKKISYRWKYSVLVIWIFVVVALFRFIDDRRIAATIAGLGFVVFPVLLLVDEIRHKSVLVIVGTLQFLALFGLPIFLLRVLNWERDFSTLQIAGIPATELHRYSNVSYVLMVSAVVLESWLERRKKRQLES